MANNKKVDQNERKEQLKQRKELEAMIQVSEGNLEIAKNDAKSILPVRSQQFLDYNMVKDVIDKEANEIVNSISEFYLGEDINDQVPYVKQKTKVDIITVSSLLFQMKTAEHAIIKLLGEIDDGNLHARTFEVLASLQRSKMEIVKHLAQFMIIMENAYKNFYEDYRVKQSDNATEDVDGEIEGGGFRTRGSKSLIQAISNVEKEMSGDDEFDENIEDTAEDTKKKKDVDGDTDESLDNEAS